MSNQNAFRLWSCFFIVALISTIVRGQEAAMLQSVEMAIIQKTNEFRESHELSAVEADKSLTKAAKKFAEFMAQTGKYGHRADGTSPAARAEAAGYTYCVVRENIAYRTNSEKETAKSLIEVFVQGWIDSPPHRENMLAEYVTGTGVAVATSDNITYYAVQMFGRPRSAAFELKLTNQSEETHTVVFRANDQQDEVKLEPRTIVTMTRCSPTTISLSGSDKSIRVDKRAEFNVTDQGLVAVD